MSTVRHRFAVCSAILLLGVVLFPTSRTDPVKAGDPLNDAVAQQTQLALALAAQNAHLATLARQQAELSASLQRIGGDLSRVGLQIDSAARQLDRLTAQLNAARADLRRYESQIASLATDLKRVAADIVATRTQLTGREALLQEHLRAAYEQSQTSVLEVLLSSGSFGAATNQLGFMLTLSDEDRRLADEIRQTRARLEVRQQTLRDGGAGLARLREGAKTRAAALKAEQLQVEAARRALAVKQAQLRDIQQAQAANLAAKTRTAEQQQRLIQAQLRALQGQQQLVEQLKAASRSLAADYTGRFEWPQEGSFVVTQEFGPTRVGVEPPANVGGTYYPHYHSGIDISNLGGCGAPIYAAADGTVLRDGRPNLAYGDTAVGVIIGDSQSLQTWYWHLAAEIVSVGQVVHAGDLIGYEGSSGMSTGCHLHFQLMANGVPVNPRAFLP